MVENLLRDLLSVSGPLQTGPFSASEAVIKSDLYQTGLTGMLMNYYIQIDSFCILNKNISR